MKDFDIRPEYDWGNGTAVIVELNEGSHSDANMMSKKIKNSLKIISKIEKQLKELPINCRVCGDRLTMASSGPDTVWACDDNIGYDDNGRVYKKGRSLIDKHYEDSRSYISFDQWTMYENLEKTLKMLLDGKIG